MKTKHVRPHCPFFNDECKHKECTSYIPKRPMAEKEKQDYAMRDWPVTDPYVRDWCSKYNMSVSGFITIIKVSYCPKCKHDMIHMPKDECRNCGWTNF